MAPQGPIWLVWPVLDPPGGLLAGPWRHTKQYIISQENTQRHAMSVGGGTLGNKVDRGNFYTLWPGFALY